ncbi:alpha-1,4-glucan lyase [Fusarium bulbicola]|nr:alpha-1,4-glucan lyase [Fusarium bulbicola]
MYLDDGSSRDGAPNFAPAGMKVGGKRAANKYCQVDIKQYTKSNNDDSGVLYMRKVTIKSPFNGFGDLKEFAASKTPFSHECTIALWHDPACNMETAAVNFSNKKVTWRNDTNSHVTVITVPVSGAHTENSVTVQSTHVNTDN